MRPRTVGVAAAMLAFVMAGCGNGTNDYYDPAPTAAGPPHTPGDVYFSQTMIRSHEQSIEMSELAAKNAGSDEVKDLAHEIQATEEREIEIMRGWLKDWGEDKPGSAEFPGMASKATMSKLEKSSGAEFDLIFLKAMIADHRGAIALATSVKSEGIHSPTSDLASTMRARQRGEVATMRKLMDG